jgi:hypothetical protein
MGVGLRKGALSVQFQRKVPVWSMLLMMACVIHGGSMEEALRRPIDGNCWGLFGGFDWFCSGIRWEPLNEALTIWRWSDAASIRTCFWGLRGSSRSWGWASIA